MFPLIDRDLSRRLEEAEGHANIRFVESRARQSPELGAAWVRAGGAYAMFDGVGSPLTQSFALGLSEPVTPGGLDSLESFFDARGAEVFHEVSPIADPSALALLPGRGYRPCELTSVLYQPLPSPLSAPPAPPLEVRPAREDERALWARTAYAGWEEFAEVRAFMAAFGPTIAGAEGTHVFLACEGGAPIATGALSLHRGVALLAGASTVPSARGRGAQRALLAARLRFAAEQGCDLAMMCASPGSGSQRNAERSGFRVAYTRIKWHKARS